MTIKKYIFGILLCLSSIANSYGADWCVQVSTFRNLEGIRQDFQKLKHHENTRIEKIGGIYSLRVGYFGTEAQAKKMLVSIREEFPKSFVRTCARDPIRVIDSTPPQKSKRTERPVNKVPAVMPPSSSDGKASPSSPVDGAAVKVSQPQSPVPAEKKSAPVPSLPPAPPAFKHTMSVAVPPKVVADPVKQAPPVLLPPKPIPAPPQASATTPAQTPAPVPSSATVSVPEAPPQASPGGDSDPKKLFEEAEKHRISGNYTLAIDLYKKIIQLSTPDDELAGRASYRIALCYDITGERRLSEASYAQAIEKWPGLDIAPAAILYLGGIKAYENKKYEGALKIFSLYLTAYPDERRRAEYMVACTLMQQGRMNAAMFLFSRVIEQYPDSPEAIESIVAFGNMGLMTPKVKATMFMKGYEWYRDPISAYDMAISKQTNTTAAEPVLYAKGCAQMILGRNEEAQRTLFKCLKTYPASYKIKLYRDTIGMNLLHVCRILYQREDYAGVVSAYFQASGNEVPLPVDASTVIIIGRSLHRMGLNEDASNFLKAARIKSFGKDAEEIGKAIDELGKTSDSLKACDDTLKEYREAHAEGRPMPVSLAIRAADCLYTAKQYGDSLPIYKWALGHPIPIEEKRWVLLHSGKACQKTGNPDGAKKAFEELKASGADEFWSKLTDFTVEDVRWTEKYNQLTKKK